MKEIVKRSNLKPLQAEIVFENSDDLYLKIYRALVKKRIGLINEEEVFKKRI